MEKLHFGDLLICDPCYIKNVTTEWGDKTEQRFDALRMVKNFPICGDGYYCVKVGKAEYGFGVDSGRLWAMRAEFDIEVEIDAGLSGYKVIPFNGTAKWDDSDLPDLDLC